MEPIYDLNGNLTRMGDWQYAWTVKNELAAAYNGVVGYEYTYDPAGRRQSVRRYTASGGVYYFAEETVFFYDGWNLIAEARRTANGQVTAMKRYLWGLDLSGSFQGAGGVGGLLWINNLQDSEEEREGSHFTTYDHNGNVMALVESETGIVTAIYEYGPFGEAIRSSGPMAKRNPFTFSTKYLDAETGLHYYGYRYYSASTGRWLNRDPLGEEGGVNVYAFVGNNPVNFADFLGFKVIIIDIGSFDLPLGDPIQDRTGDFEILKNYFKTVDGFIEKLNRLDEKCFDKAVELGKVKFDNLEFKGSKAEFLEKVSREKQSKYIKISGGGKYSLLKAIVKNPLEESYDQLVVMANPAADENKILTGEIRIAGTDMSRRSFNDLISGIQEKTLTQTDLRPPLITTYF